VQRFYGGVEPLGDREIAVIAASSALARDGHVIEVQGINLTNYRKVPIVLYQHDPTLPIGTCTAIGVEGDVLAAKIEFAPAGISRVADEACAMCKASVLRGISIGFDPDLETAEPLDPRRPRAGQRFKRCELLEISVVSVPADVNAAVVARSFASSRVDLRKMVDRLPRVSKVGIQRAAAILPMRFNNTRLLSHAGHVWAILEGRERDRSEQRAWVKQKLERLRATAPG
jgi:HK97 family phage prohead protease